MRKSYVMPLSEVIEIEIEDAILNGSTVEDMGSGANGGDDFNFLS